MAGMKWDNSVDVMIYVLAGITLVLSLVAIVSILLMFW